MADSDLKRSCLTIDDLYRYVAVPPGERGFPELDAHLAQCSHCRQELAEILELLHPKPEEAPPEVSEEEIARTVKLIQEVARRERRQASRPRWAKWAVAAAAATIFFGAGVAGYWYMQYRNSTQDFQLAKAMLEESYAPDSKSGLRLDLPFRSAATSRAATGSAALDKAQAYFLQASRDRSKWVEPYLGMAAVSLQKEQYAEARAAFEHVLDIDARDIRALVGRGVAGFEGSKPLTDPIQRSKGLDSARSDFEAVLRQRPDSAEARYNLIWTLFETGRRAEALAEIKEYLSRDPDSIWAVRLRELQVKIQVPTVEAVFKEVDRLAKRRDAEPLVTIARLAPEQAAIAIRGVLRRSLQAEAVSSEREEPGAGDLRWAAETLERAYSEAAGDHSWRRLFRYYDGLSPPQRSLKRSLDRELDRRAELLRTRQAAAALQGSETLERSYSLLHDIWQVYNSHFLRGNCYYYLADFDRAEAEYREMLRCAEAAGPPELRARALASLLSAYIQLNRLDQVETRIADLRNLVSKHQLISWEVIADVSAGSRMRKLNLLDQSLRFYTRALALAYRNYDLPALDPLLQSLSTLMIQLDRPEDAASLYAEAVSVLDAHRHSAGFGGQTEVESNWLTLLLRQGEAALELNNLELAESAFRRGLEGKLDDMREEECLLRLGLAEALIDGKRFSEAGAELDRASSLAASGNFEAHLWRAGLLRGVASRGMGDLDTAVPAFDRAIEVLEHHREGPGAFDLRGLFGCHRMDPYREIVALLALSMHDTRKAMAYADRAKSLSIPVPHDRAAARQASVTAAEAIPLRNTLAVDYFFAGDELLAFVSAGDAPHLVPLGATRAAVESDVRRFLDSTRPGGDLRTFDALARSLHHQLIEPVLDDAGRENVGALVILPDGPLYRLPFAGLKDAGGRYLLETYPLSYAPSRSVLQRCLSLDRPDVTSRDRSVLLLDGTANLAGARRELAQIAALYGTTHAALAGAQDMASLAGRAADAEILHFAGHGKMKDGNPVLELSAGPNPVWLDSREISTWRFRRNGLVTLAGCETGAGPIEEGYAPWGLVPAFLNAGAPALVVSLLPVDDAATEEMTDRFYKLLAKGSISRASALQQAQLALLASSRRAGRPDPALWLPYVLVGDPR